MQWTTAYINDLPDECFAYIEPGGRKDEEGKTVPRSLRHLPYKDKDGKIDLPHLRNALARLPQTDIPLEAKKQALRKLLAAAREAGVEVDEERYRREYDLAEQGLLKIPFFRLGRWQHPRYGEIQGDERLFAAFIKNFKDGVLGRPVFVRLGHDADGKPTFGDAPAEAWVKDIVREGDVLYAVAEPTSPEVLDLVRQRRYRFASAEYVPDFVDRETGEHKGPVLKAIALTNEPFLTRLPEARVLADPPGTIYLDYREVESVEKEPLKELLEALKELPRRLAEAVGAKVKAEEPAAQPAEAKLAEYERRLTAAEERAKAAEEKLVALEAEKKLAELVQAGIPPAMVDKARVLLANLPRDLAVKLADGANRPLAELVYELLEAMPSEARVKLGQMGAQESRPPGVSAAEVYGDVVPQLKEKKGGNA